MFTCVHSTTHSPISRKKKEKEKQKLEPENQSQTFIYISYMYHYIYRLDPNIKFSIARLKKRKKRKIAKLEFALESRTKLDFVGIQIIEDEDRHARPRAISGRIDILRPETKGRRGGVLRSEGVALLG